LSTHEDVRDRLAASAATVTGLAEQVQAIVSLTAAISECLEAGGTLYTCGNGGSAAQALHLAEELVGRYRGNRPPRSALCLNADPTALTCIANDFGFEHVFSRPCETLLRPADVLLVFTTSGNSENLVRALDVARSRGATTLGLLGNGGGRCLERCDHAVVIGGTAAGAGRPIESAHIQEAHLVILHLICEAFE